ncbi:hypothetical protein CSOJ01_03922 [Colletotrichum sojae]|uniref:Uncharacterized protein n=1 Tax=Colletotrichum sojae TaxID=2175907 RepID=A0A8H6MZE7_9PEZI|nr:hypothetical protein CSOJ01_03922 [Colletotrichum sojae]
MGSANGYGRASIPLKSFIPISYTRLSSYNGSESEDAQLIGAQASPSPSKKTFNHTSGSRQTEPTIVLEKRFFKGLVSHSWIIHFIAVLFTAGIVQFTFRRLYWFDEDNWESQWMAKLKISQDVAMNGLQFVAKIHEIIIVASVSAMTMHFCRRMLVGDGIPFGFLSGAYQVSSAEWLFSKVSFWATMPRPRKGERKGYVSSPRRVLLGLGAACLCIYCNMVGPSSAIAIIPELRWWDVWAPFEGKLVASYITANSSEIYPSEISELNIMPGCEEVESETSGNVLTFCPDRGFGELLEWAKSFAVGVPSSPMDVTQPLSGVRREVTSSTMGLEASAGDFSNENLLAVATTPHSSLTELGGMFWSYLDAYDIAGVRKIERPQVSPQEEVWSPLVQVQCKMFQYSHEWMTSHNSPHKDMDIPHFDSRAMRDFTARARKEDNFYEKGENGAGRWSLPQMHWNYTRNKDSLRATNFTWVDVASMFPTKSPSLGSVLELPMGFVKQDGEEVYQGSLVIPCLMDVRWAGVELSLDPAVDRLFRHNMSDLPKVLSGFWDSEIKVSEKSLLALSQRNVPISPSWANLLNKPAGNITTRSGRRIQNSTAVAVLVEQFISSGGNRIFEPPLFEELRNAGNISDVPDITGRTVATIVAHALVDGLSRIRYTANLGLALEAHGNGTVSWVGLTNIAGGIRQHEVLQNASLVDEYTPFHWKLRKYGYGYGLGRRTTMFGVTILLIHAGAVLLYAAYVLCFRLSPYGWSSSAWGSLDGMLLLAIKSRSSDAAKYAGTGIMSNDLFRARTRVRARGDDGVELIVGQDLEEEHKLVKGEKYL